MFAPSNNFTSRLLTYAIRTGVPLDDLRHSESLRLRYISRINGIGVIHSEREARATCFLTARRGSARCAIFIPWHAAVKDFANFSSEFAVNES